MTDEKLDKFVNSSGFPLQIGLEYLVNKTKAQHGWEVLYKEHPWKSFDTKNSGFIDLILANQYGTSALVVECKRVKDTSWIFLMPSERQMNRRHSKAWVSRINDVNFLHYDWTDIDVDDPSPESSFCIVPGQNNNSQPMLERIAAELVESTEAFATEDVYILNKKTEVFRLYFNVIVTTADLKLCLFDPEKISIEDGQIDGSNFKTVPFLRFRKSLSTKNVTELKLSEFTPYELTNAKENTIFVVNSNSLIEFLRTFEIDQNSIKRFK